MTKILHIITRSDMGGSAQNTLLTCIELPRSKYEVVLVQGLSHESNMTESEGRAVARNVQRARENGVKVISVASLVRRINPVRDIQAFFSLLRLIVREKPAIVHTHTSKAGLLGRWAAWIAGVPIIVHTPHGHVFYGHFSIIVTPLFFLIEKITALITDRIVALTAGEKNDYTALAVYYPENIEIIHSGVNINQYAQVRIDIPEKKRSLGLDTDALVVGTVGWLLPIKGSMHLLNAMVKIWQNRSDVELVYVGKGDLQESLKQRSLTMGVSEKVNFLGWRDDVNEIIPVFDLLALPSLNEGMGRVLVEAMAAGKPVVASNVGGIPDLVDHGKNGFLVKPGDENGLAGAIEKLLADKKMRLEMGARGRAMAENFGVDKMIEKIDSLYQDLLYQYI